MMAGQDIDVQALQKLRTLGGDGLVSKMAELFISHAESALREAAAGVESGDLESVHRAAHSLKSSAGNLGAQRVQDLADRIDQLSERRSGEIPEEIRRLLAELEAAYASARIRLTEELKGIHFEDSDR